MERLKQNYNITMLLHHYRICTTRMAAWETVLANTKMFVKGLSK